MTQSCSSILKKRNITDIPIYELTMYRALEKAQECQLSGTKVFVCRGGSASFLREHLDAPIVDIRHSFLSFFVTIKKRLLSDEKVAVIGFSQFCDTARKYNMVLNESLIVIPVQDAQEFESAFLQAREAGAQVIIGGLQVKRICDRNDFPFFSIYPEEMEVEQALDEAFYNLYVEEEREKQFSIISTILHSTSEGIIGIDTSGAILHINKNAQELLQYSADGENRYLKSLISNKNILDTIRTGDPIHDELLTIDKLSLVISCLPIVQGGNITGAVITMQEETNIQIIDSKIRKRQISTGRFAKMNFNDVIGESPEIIRTKKTAKKFAQTDSTILLSGETGTGKELFAQSIHNYSMRRNMPFIAINCAALPQSILESELFGYAGGAFTGAKAGGKAGVFEQAHKGTVFLDEITEIPMDVQAKLLRVLQEKEITRIGDNRMIPIDIRIIAACNKNLYQEVKNRQFREDLYYRLCVLELKLPSLRDRKDDIPALFSHFLQGERTLTDKALEILYTYSWPGNVRQLINVTERANVVLKDNVIDEDVMGDLIDSQETGTMDTGVENQHPSILDYVRHTLDDFTNIASVSDGLLRVIEKHVILDILAKTNGNREKAAAILGISISTLWRKEKSYKS